MTMLDKLATAMQESPAWPAVFDAGTAQTLALAMLDAMQEPSEGMVEAAAAGLEGFNQRRDGDKAGAKLSWQAMIQHIRNGGA
jgi:hypothetical protein